MEKISDTSLNSLFSTPNQPKQASERPAPKKRGRPPKSVTKPTIDTLDIIQYKPGDIVSYICDKQRITGTITKIRGDSVFVDSDIAVFGSRSKEIHIDNIKLVRNIIKTHSGKVFGQTYDRTTSSDNAELAVLRSRAMLKTELLASEDQTLSAANFCCGQRKICHDEKFMKCYLP